MKRRALLAAALAYPLVGRAQQKCSLPTPEDMEGPFYKGGAPSRVNLVPAGVKAEGLVLSGQALSMGCTPMAGVKLDFWHADEKGEYDNAGYRYRGVVTTDAQGRYRLETILPAVYPGRPRHIHVKTLAPNGRHLTTQLYFPGESRGADKALVVKMEKRDGVHAALYDFVLAA
jgi:protocatechuate 3,4-dioxygenase beta subunit